MIMKQYRYQCCGYIVSERFEDTHCRQCGRLSPILEEVDKEDMVYMLPAQVILEMPLKKLESGETSKYFWTNQTSR